jgi:orotidine-5'-phosphate decarboxylase
MTELYEKWMKLSKEKNSLLCAGLDPSFASNNKGKGLPDGTDKVQWAKDYIDAIAPYTVALKPNTKFWIGYEEELQEVLDYAKEKNLILIDDSKIADIGNTNKAAIRASKRQGYDCQTLAPYAQNIKQAGLDAQELEMDLITMCLMSNPEYEKGKNLLVPLSQEELSAYKEEDLEKLGEENYVKRFIWDAKNASTNNIAGLVIGATGHVKVEEIKKAMEYSNEKTLILMPGIGAQGGDVESLKELGEDILRRIMINVGRGLMHPQGKALASKEEWAREAQNYRDSFNQVLFEK